MSRLRLSVIIAHRNDSMRLWDTCDNLFTNAAFPEDYEVIVIDDASAPVTASPGADGLSGSRLTVGYLEDQVGVGAARMIGAARAWGDALIFTDAHVRVPAGWDEQVRRSLEAAPHQSLICSRYLTDKPHDPGWCDSDDIAGATLTHFCLRQDQKWAICRLSPVPTKPGNVGLIPVPAVIGAFYIIRRSYFERLHGFDGLKGYGGDEQLISWKVHLTGGSVFCDHNLPVTHLSGGIPESRSSLEDLVPQIVNCLFVERLVGGPDWFDQLAALAPAHLLPLIQQSMLIPIAEYGRIKEPDQIAVRFGIQTLQEALQTAEMTFKPSLIPTDYYE